MKALISKTGLLLAALMLTSMSLQAEELKKDLHKEFSTNSSSELVIDNSFGEVIFETWNKNQVVIDVLVTVKHTNKDKAQEMLDRITVEFSEEGNQLKAKTVMKNKKEKETWGKDNKFSIDYQVKMPESIDLDLQLAFGNVELGSVSGDVKMELAFGDFTIGDIDGMTDLEINHGSGSIGELNEAKLQVNLCDIVGIRKVESLKLELNMGDLKLGQVKNLNAQVSKGDLTVKEVQKGFDRIKIENAMGSVNLGVADGAGFTFKADMSMGDIKYPKSAKDLKKSKSMMSSSVQGVVGNGAGEIDINASMGDVEIRIVK